MLSLCLLLASSTPAEAAAAYADSLVGTRDIEALGTRYALDSVGLVRAVFMTQGIDVFQAPALEDPARTGVDVIYQYAALNGRLHTSRKPRVGDLVFFGKTRDADGDGAPDSISHLGIVTALASDGTARVVTTTKSQVVAVSLNRLRPREPKDELGAALNSRFFIGRDFAHPKLVSELFYTFATLQQ
jgi:hypothetical protein